MNDRTDTLAAPASFAEVRALLRELPAGDQEAAREAQLREAQLLKPPGALGRLEELAQWLATWQGRHPPRLERPHVAVFAGNHGVAAQGVSAYPSAVTAEMVRAFTSGHAAVNQLAALHDCELRVYELALEQPTADFTQAPAMTEDECVRAMAYGMMAVEPGYDVYALGEMGIANTTSAAALACALQGGPAEDWVGSGTGVDQAGRARKVAAVEAGLARHREALGDPLEVLRRLGGLELAALAGAIVAARLARTPVLLDGYACTAAAAVLHGIDPSLLEHCRVAHRSQEPGHGRLLERLGMAPLLDLDMRLGEASGAVLAIGLLKAAVATHTGMATFSEAGVSGPA